jgi:signal transduction histidine kinase
MAMTGMKRALVQDTVRALLEMRRLVPILVVGVPLVVAQAHYSHDRLAIPLAVLTCLAFVLVAPLSWRALFPEDQSEGHGVARLLAYACIGATVVGSLGVVTPELLHMGRTFLGAPPSVAVSLALFLVGGWGLGRDIGLEASLRRARARAAALAREAERSQLLALKAHLDPHFLFNTLNAIAEWCREDGETAERAVLELSSMLRTILEGVRLPAWPLARELDLVRALFSLHLVRGPKAFSLVWDVAPEVSDTLVPPLVLLPLAENAVKHGPAAGRRGEITVRAHAAGGELTVRIENPGTYAGPRPGGEGVPVVQRRLDLAYGGKAALSLSAQGARTRAELRVPSSGPAPGVVV